MCTESYIKAIPVPRDPVCPQVVDAAGWLKLLRRNTVQVTVGLAAVHPLGHRRITQLRTVSSRYRTNYLFFSPDTPLTVQVSGGVTKIPPGSLLWMPPGIPYSLYRSGPDGKGALFRLRFDVMEDSVTYAPGKVYIVTDDCPWYMDLYSRIAAEQGGDDTFADEYARSLITQLSVLVFRTGTESADTREGITPARMRRVRAFFMEHITERPSPADLAARAGLSPAYFAKVFVRDVGQAPRQWMTEQRVRYGAGLLRDSAMNVSETAEWLGYRDLRLFIRQFKNVFGDSPAVYRRGKV